MFAEYRCKQGYILSGDPVISCTGQEWDPPQVRCKLLTCSSPQSEGLLGTLGTTEMNLSEMPVTFEYGEQLSLKCQVG